ncbi:hypothetical protein GGS26DRAFT_586793 [Hypomontagnella submonticulosa]|nr:hypothetical protein GGS26DRAFT_586793 [Hypomontagnella submonticulosa]
MAEKIIINDELSVVFSEATTPEVKIQCSKLASTAFGKSLSKAEYLEREEFLGTLPLTQRSGWRFWSLTRVDNPEQVLAMCKTMHRDLLVRDDTNRRQPRQEQGYCVVSVVTDASYRGRGLASILLKSVAQWMDGPGGAMASMLYSDVGEFYVSKGWDIHEAFQSTLTVPVSLSPEAPVINFPETRLLTADDIPNLCDRDVKSLRNHHETYDLAVEQTLVTVLPTTNLITWLQARTGFMNDKTNGVVPRTKGSICESAGAWLYWYHDLRHRKLTIQRVKLPLDPSNATTTRALARLLLDALEEALKWQISDVVVWNPSPQLHDAMKILSEEMGIEIKNEKRESTQLPCFRWRGGEKKPTTVWPNEFYAWS